MQRAHRRAHALIWPLLAIALPIMLAAVFIATPRLSRDAPAVRLEAPAPPPGSSP